MSPSSVSNKFWFVFNLQWKWFWNDSSPIQKFSILLLLLQRQLVVVVQRLRLPLNIRPLRFIDGQVKQEGKRPSLNTLLISWNCRTRPTLPKSQSCRTIRLIWLTVALWFLMLWLKSRMRLILPLASEDHVVKVLLKNVLIYEWESSDWLRHTEADIQMTC